MALCAGAPLIIHPGRDERAPFEILDILEASGADISRTVMSHLDRTFFDDKVVLEFAQHGCFLEYDFFGIECSHYPVCKNRDLHVRFHNSCYYRTLPPFKRMLQNST